MCLAPFSETCLRSVEASLAFSPFPLIRTLRRHPDVVHVVEGFFEQQPEMVIGQRVEDPPPLSASPEQSQVPQDSEDEENSPPIL